MHLLPLLIGQANVGRKRKESSENVVRKWSPAERRETFICHIEVCLLGSTISIVEKCTQFLVLQLPDELEERIKVLKEKLLNRRETFQPLLVVVGPLVEIKEAYVVVDNIRYKAHSCLEALDLCFKLFFALECKYPQASHSIWHFIQLVCYNIITIPNNPIKSVKELQGLTENALKVSGLL